MNYIGRDIARLEIHRMSDTRTGVLLSDIAFILAVGMVTALFVFGARHMWADLFMWTWKSFAGK